MCGTKQVTERREIRDRETESKQSKKWRGKRKRSKYNGSVVEFSRWGRAYPGRPCAGDFLVERS